MSSGVIWLTPYSDKARPPVVIWRVDVMFVHKQDWKYEGSKASASGGGRTQLLGFAAPQLNSKGARHTFSTESRLLAVSRCSPAPLLSHDPKEIPRRPPGPAPDVLKIEGNWKDPISKALQAKKPPAAGRRWNPEGPRNQCSFMTPIPLCPGKCG